MKSYLIYDLEIEKAILGKGERRLEDIEYCSGWNDHKGMGISCLCAYDSVEDRYRIFCKDNMNEFYLMMYMNDRLFVTFNGVGFDNKVLEAHGYSPPAEGHYDILQELWIAHGLSPTFQYPSHVGFNMDATCRVNDLQVKTGNGALAPINWQRGNIGTVIDYCLNDVKMTQQLFNKILQDGELISPKTKQIIKMRSPW